MKKINSEITSALHLLDAIIKSVKSLSTKFSYQELQRESNIFYSWISVVESFTSSINKRTRKVPEKSASYSYLYGEGIIAASKYLPDNNPFDCKHITNTTIDQTIVELSTRFSERAINIIYAANGLC